MTQLELLVELKAQHPRVSAAFGAWLTAQGLCTPFIALRDWEQVKYLVGYLKAGLYHVVVTMPAQAADPVTGFTLLTPEGPVKYAGQWPTVYAAQRAGILAAFKLIDADLQPVTD